MPHRTYLGPHDEVELPVLDVKVKRGEQVEVDADLAAQLDEQPDTWAKPTSKSSKETDQ